MVKGLGFWGFRVMVKGLGFRGLGFEWVVWDVNWLSTENVDCTEKETGCMILMGVGVP